MDDMIKPAQSGDAALAEILACAGRTWAEPSARIEHRSDIDVVRATPPADPDALGRLVRLAGRAFWERVSGGKAFGHVAAEGFLEPTAGRYMIDFGSYAEICAGGVTFGGRSGRPLHTLRPSSTREGDVLWLLRLVLGTTDARPDGTETLRGTSGRKYSAHVAVRRAATGSARPERPPPPGGGPGQPAALALTVWTDGLHIRRVQYADIAPAETQPAQGGSVRKVLTLDLWDFGVPVQELDWSRLPTFRTPG